MPLLGTRAASCPANQERQLSNGTLALVAILPSAIGWYAIVSRVIYSERRYLDTLGAAVKIDFGWSWKPVCGCARQGGGGLRSDAQPLLVRANEHSIVGVRGNMMRLRVPECRFDEVPKVRTAGFGAHHRFGRR